MASSDEVSSPPRKAPPDPSDAEPHPDDLQKLLQWQAERRERRLRGEYESAVRHLADVVNDNLDTPLRISSVRVEGAANTRKSFLYSLIGPSLPPPSEPSTLQSVLHVTRKISQSLQRSDIFTSVEARLDKASDEHAVDDAVDVVFVTREKGRFFLKSSTELGNNEGTASASGRIRNVFGGAETFEANLALGTRTRHAFRASLTVPLSASLLSHGELTAFGEERDHTSHASCMEGLRGITAAFTRGGHKLAYMAVARHIGGLTPNASLSIREAAGQSVKSSVTHTYVHDTRDDRIAATRGMYTKFFHEFAGLGGGVKFYKMETEGQISRRVSSNVSASLSARSGILLGLSHPTLFPDRFQLGGPTSVRSFRTNSMGPRDGTDSIGGDFHYSAGASIVSNIPTKPHWPVKTHVWLNAGRLASIDQSKPLLHSLRSSLASPSIAAGVGLIYRFDPVRVEVNFGMPLVASKSDGHRRGLQVGIGLEFL